MSKPTSLQKALQKKSKHLMGMARIELAKRQPEYRHEIRAGDWDTSNGMRQVISDLKRMGI